MCDAQRLWFHIFSPLADSTKRLVFYISFPQQLCHIFLGNKLKSESIFTLVVHHNINRPVYWRDDWVVDRIALQDAGGYMVTSLRWNGCPRLFTTQTAKEALRQPAHQEALHHDHHQPGHLPLCWLDTDSAWAFAPCWDREVRKRLFS